jgi:hypothetical protein
MVAWECSTNGQAGTLPSCHGTAEAAWVDRAKFLSLNQQVVRATAMAAWNAYVSDHGVDSTRNPIGDRMFGNSIRPTARPTRARAAGEVRVPPGAWTPS